MVRLSVLIAIVLAAMLAACAASIRPEDGSVSASTFGAIPLFSAQEKPLVPPPGATIAGAQVAFSAPTKELNVLAISGGGADGAFGAGVLKGWSETGKRPVFNIVTGVSTGALIANFAFLGSEWDSELERFYTQITQEQIYVDNGFLFGLAHESLYDTAPFRAMVEKVVTDSLLDAIAEQHRQGRRLYVATTDLDSGTIVVWDMGGIAASGHKDRLETYRDVLVASAAFPGFFKPVYVRHSDEHGKTRMHVDGGVKAPILLRSFMVSGPQKAKTVYMLINGKLALKTGDAPVPATALGISKRSIAELMRGLTYKTIYQAYVTTRQAKGKFRILAVPDDVHDIEDALRFRPKEMRALFQRGREAGGNAASWSAEPPRLEPLERIEAQAGAR